MAKERPEGREKDVRFWFVILLLALCAGCGTPSPDMLGADRVSRQVAGHRLDLYRRGDRFQVIRFGWLPRQERAGIARLRDGGDGLSSLQLRPARR